MNKKEYYVVGTDEGYVPNEYTVWGIFSNEDKAKEYAEALSKLKITKTYRIVIDKAFEGDSVIENYKHEIDEWLI